MQTMKYVFVVALIAALIVASVQQCVETDITDTLQGIDKSFHTVNFLFGGSVQYNFTQNTLYRDQVINVALLNKTEDPFVFNNDACDFNSSRTQPKWTDTVSPAPNCDRTVLSALDFRTEFAECKNLQREDRVISGSQYDAYTGVFVAQVLNPVGDILNIGVVRTTYIKTRFVLKLQKDIILTTTLNITQPLDVFSAAALIQTFNYEVEKVHVGFVTAQATSPQYSLQIFGAGAVAGAPHQAVVKAEGSFTTPTFSCPNGLSNCQRWLLEIDPKLPVPECSWQGQEYDVVLQVECGGCLIQGNLVTIAHKISLSDYCDIVDTTFDLTGNVVFYRDSARTTPLQQPVSIETPAFIRAELQSQFAPMIDIDMRQFKICSYTIAGNCDAAPNTLALVAGSAVTAKGTEFNVLPADMTSVVITEGNSVNFDFSMVLKFATGLIDQSHLSTSDGQLLFEFIFDITYVSKKKRTTLNFLATKETETESISLPATGFKVAPNLDNKNAAPVQTASFFALAVVFVLYFLF